MTALITGAAGGIGRAFAAALAQEGHRLVLVDINQEKLEILSEELHAQYPKSITDCCVMNLAKVDSGNQLYDWCRTKGYEIDILINNAGQFIYSDLIRMNQDKLESLVLLNIMTLTKCCQLFGADMANRGGGYILNMSSFSHWTPYAGLNLYAASKAYIHKFSISFRREVRERNIKVTTVCPAGVATDLYGLPNKLQTLGRRLGILLAPDRCVKSALRGLWKGKACIVPGWWNRLLIPICTHLPEWAIRMIRKYTMQYQSK